MRRSYITIMICMIIGCGILCGCSSSEKQSEVTGQSTNNAAQIIEDIATTQAFTDEAVKEEDIKAIVNSGINAPSSMNGQPWHFTVITDSETLEQIAGGMNFGAGAPSGFDSETFNKESGKIIMPDNANMPDGTNIPDGASIPDADNFPEGADKPGNISSGSDGNAPYMPASNGASKAGVADAPLAIVISCRSGSELDAGLATQNMSAEAQLLGYGTKIISSATMTLNGSRQQEFKELLGIPDDMTAVCVLIIGKTDADVYDAVSSATTRNSESEIVTYLK